MTGMPAARQYVDGWYAAYLHARQNGSPPNEASEAARRYMAEAKQVVVPPA